MDMSDLTIWAIFFLGTPVLTLLGMFAFTGWIESRPWGNDETETSN